jgi:hypothetical protein
MNTQLSKGANQVNDKRLIILLLLCVCLSFGAIACSQNPKPVSNAPKQPKQTVVLSEAEKEADYQKGINLIQEQKWDEAAVTLTKVHEDNYKYGKQLYEYASAKGWAMNDKYNVAHYNMKNIPANYDGPFKENIISFKKECESKSTSDQTVNLVEPNSGKVFIGMTKEQAEITMGKPYDINRTVGSYGTHEQWCYRGSIYLYFDNGVLTSWQD